MAAELEEDEPWVASQTLKIPKVMAENTLLFLGITTLMTQEIPRLLSGWGSSNKVAMEMHGKI